MENNKIVPSEAIMKKEEKRRSRVSIKNQSKMFYYLEGYLTAKYEDQWREHLEEGIEVIKQRFIKYSRCKKDLEIVITKIQTTYNLTKDD